MDYPECIVMDRLAIPPGTWTWVFSEAGPFEWGEDIDPTAPVPIKTYRYERDPAWGHLWWRVQ